MSSSRGIINSKQELTRLPGVFSGLPTLKARASREKLIRIEKGRTIPKPDTLHIISLERRVYAASTRAIRGDTLCYYVSLPDIRRDYVPSLDITPGAQGDLMAYFIIATGRIFFCPFFGTFSDDPRYLRRQPPEKRNLYRRKRRR